MADVFQAKAEKDSTTTPRTTRTMPVARFKVLGVALFAKTAAILAHSSVNRMHPAYREVGDRSRQGCEGHDEDAGSHSGL